MTCESQIVKFWIVSFGEDPIQIAGKFKILGEILPTLVLAKEPIDLILIQFEINFL